MKGIDDRTVSIVASMDEEKYISNFASADFTIADDSLKNYSLSESSTDSVSFEDMKKFNSISGVEESGAICMSESMQNMKGTPYERLVKLYETHPEWFTHGTSEKKYFAPIVYGEKSINSHIYGVDRIVYEKMNMDTKAVDWETFSSGNYAIVSAPVEMLMCGKVTHKNLIDNRPLFRYYSSIWIEKTSLIQYNKVSGRYLYEGKNTNH